MDTREAFSREPVKKGVSTSFLLHRGPSRLVKGGRDLRGEKVFDIEPQPIPHGAAVRKEGRTVL